MFNAEFRRLTYKYLSGVTEVQYFLQCSITGTVYLSSMHQQWLVMWHNSILIYLRAHLTAQSQLRSEHELKNKQNTHTHKINNQVN